MSKTCKGCGISKQWTWRYIDYCSRSCVMTKIRELTQAIRYLQSLLNL